MAKSSEKMFRPAASHSLLLALEPRQVFDGALGAAIGEALDGPEADQAEPEVEKETEVTPRTEGGGADQVTARGGDDSEKSGESPAISLDWTGLILDGGVLDLGSLEIDSAGYDGPLTLVLRVEGGILYAPENDRVILSDDGLTLTLTNMTAAEINAALKETLFLDGAGPGRNGPSA